VIGVNVRWAAASGPQALSNVEAAGEGHSSESALGLAEIVGGNLRRLRGRRGLSLERLARLSGVSRAMLGQVELGRSVPSINVVWKITQALRVSISSLLEEKARVARQVLRVEQAKRLVSSDGSFVSRALFASEISNGNTEFYEISLAPQSRERMDAYALGTQANLVVHSGCLELLLEADAYCLGPGDAIVFDADVSHSYENQSNLRCHLYLVLSRRTTFSPV